MDTMNLHVHKTNLRLCPSLIYILFASSMWLSDGVWEIIFSPCPAGDGDQLQKAMQSLSEMKGIGLCPNTITYSILLVASEK